MALLRQGREAYNAKDYRRAETLFRDAIVQDGLYAKAYLYLGHSLYKQGRGDEAVGAWRNAVQTGEGSEAAKEAEAKIRYFEQGLTRMVEHLEARVRQEP